MDAAMPLNQMQRRPRIPLSVRVFRCSGREQERVAAPARPQSRSRRIARRRSEAKNKVLVGDAQGVHREGRN
jgi:hypothetical protein